MKTEELKMHGRINLDEVEELEKAYRERFNKRPHMNYRIPMEEYAETLRDALERDEPIPVELPGEGEAW